VVTNSLLQLLSVQARLFKSLKLWSFYIDLEESLGTVESAKSAYDKVLELKIANAQVIVNYAQFLEENKYFEESFKVYERGVELFTFPVSFEIWNIYLSKFTKRYVSTRISPSEDTMLIQKSGRHEARAYPRPVRTVFRKMPSQILQTYIHHVRQARGRARLGQAGDGHLRPRDSIGC
jgi:hypothetical protein